MGNVFGMVGAALIGTVCILLFTDFIGRMKRPEKKEETNKGGITVLAGELVDMAYDRETGLTRIEVRDSSGMTQTGFSTLTINQMESLYAGKGWVQISTCRR